MTEEPTSAVARLQLPSILCIDYPGYVESAENAVRTLGGIERIEKAFFSHHGKLFLNYCPNNIFSKVLCSSESENLNQPNPTLTSRTRANENNEYRANESVFSNSCLLLKINKKPANPPGSFTYESKLIGKIEKIFTFRKLSDFQYLPMSKVDNVDAKYEGFYKNFHFDQIDDFKQDLKAKIPLYVLPPFFSRFDDPVNYAFKPEPNKKIASSLEYFSSMGENSGATTSKTRDESINVSFSDDATACKLEQESFDTADESFSSDLIRSVRQERSSQALLITFDCLEVPQSKPSISE
jgi:general transcription factor 3C polypeptide 5 (transcription factor C subunit 1)